MKKQEFWNIENVSSFRNIDVVDGEVSMSDEEWEDRLDEIHGNVEICGMSYSSGRALRELDPTAFRCGKNDEESSIQSDLETQLDREDSTDIEFIGGDEDDLSDEDDDLTDYDRGVRRLC